jgi:hypothetical protein
MSMNRTFMALLLAAATLGPAALADRPGRHPRYLHARSDLRVALSLLRVQEEPNVTRHLRVAEREVEDAIREVTRAAVIDRKDVDEHLRPDAHAGRLGRFQRIMALLRSARADISGEEDVAAARGWRNVAFRHIDTAMDFVRRAAREAHLDREWER